MEKFYFLNVTNADDVMEGDKPKLRDVGPYAVRKQKTREVQRAPLAAARAAAHPPLLTRRAAMLPSQASTTRWARLRSTSGSTWTGTSP